MGLYGRWLLIWQGFLFSLDELLQEPVVLCSEAALETSPCASVYQLAKLLWLEVEQGIELFLTIKKGQ